MSGYFAHPYFQWARSSAGEHFVDIEGVTGSIPVVPTTESHLEATTRLIFSKN